MDVVVIDGVEYVKASELARRFKYTADYVGQLCRGRKVDAKLIGRTWYVSPLSLTNHKTGRYVQKSNSDEKTSSTDPKRDESRQNVAPVIRKSTARSVEFARRDSQFARHIGWSPAKYEEDDADLLPLMAKSPSTLKVDIAEAESLVITGTEKPTRLEAEPIPAVALGGTLKIASLDELYDVKDEENIAIAHDVVVETEVDEEVPQSVPVRRDDPVRSEKPVAAKKKPAEIPESKATYEVAIREMDAEETLSETIRPDFTPRRLRHPESSVPDTLVVAHSVTDGTRFGSAFFVYGAVLVFGLMLLLATAFLEFQVTANALSSSLMITW